MFYYGFAQNGTNQQNVQQIKNKTISYQSRHTTAVLDRV